MALQEHTVKTAMIEKNKLTRRLAMIIKSDGKAKTLLAPSN
jgi:hypothetical protein